MSIDAQGAELSILASGGNFLRRVKRIVLEVQDVPESRRAELLYEDQPTKRQVIDHMYRHGFLVERKNSEKSRGARLPGWAFTGTQPPPTAIKAQHGNRKNGQTAAIFRWF